MLFYATPLLNAKAVDLQEHQSILSFLDNALHESVVEPLDLEADAIIRAYFKRNPEAAYRITKLAMKTGKLAAAEPPAPIVQRRRWFFLFR